MAEQKKRFPWCLGVCAVVLLLLGTVVGFIETVGRQGTLTRAETINDEEQHSKADVLRILGPPTSTKRLLNDEDHEVGTLYEWEDGPIRVRFVVVDNSTFLNIDRSAAPQRDTTWWHVRRWAEQAYTAIHGPRR